MNLRPIKILPVRTKSTMLPVVYNRIFHTGLVPLPSNQFGMQKEKQKPEMRTGKFVRHSFSSLGIIMPFQPSMWDEKTTITEWQKTIKAVQLKMKDKFSADCISKLTGRLQTLFTQLNFNTQRKTLAILLTPEEEKILYLNFHARPVVILGKEVTALDLTVNIGFEATFFLLTLTQNSIEIYESGNRKFHKRYAPVVTEDADTCLYKAANTIDLLNSKNDKPVFISGSPNLVELFCNNYKTESICFPLLYHIGPFNNADIQSLVDEITRRWNYWRPKFIAGKVLLAQKANQLISSAEKVMDALSKQKDGFILVEKRLKQSLQNASAISAPDIYYREWVLLIERFLARGNEIVFTENGVLCQFGGIVLIQANQLNYSQTDRPFRQSRCGSEGQLF